MSPVPPFEKDKSNDSSVNNEKHTAGQIADDPPKLLRLELEGEIDSFILKLRVDLRWETQHAAALLTSMYSYIHSTIGASNLSRQTAGEMWQLIQFIQNWSSHPDFRSANLYPDEYYNSVYEILLLLGDWYFTGECPFTKPEAILEEIQQLQQLITD